jgi:hypothetical protein
MSAAPNVGPPVQWTLVQCERCEMPSLDIHENHRAWLRRRPPIAFRAPHQIRSAQACLRPPGGVGGSAVCLDAKAYAACVIMVRRTLEGTCLARAGCS